MSEGAAGGGERFQRLDADQVRDSVVQLHRRIQARFPDRGLTIVAAELIDLIHRVDEETRDSHTRLRRTTMVARVLAGLAVLLAIAALALTLPGARDIPLDHALQWVPLVESGINTLIFVAIAVLFLWAAPERMARAGLLSLLHRLRSLAHVIDMHQLPKQPERLRAAYQSTPESLPNDLSDPEMHHYLNYCAEMLSLVAKAAALCAERSSDGTVLDTVSNVETLTTHMSDKVSQKVALLNRLDRS